MSKTLRSRGGARVRLRERLFINRRHRRGEVHPAEQCADGHGRPRPLPRAYYLLPASKQASSLVIGCVALVTSSAAAAQHGQVAAAAQHGQVAAAAPHGQVGSGLAANVRTQEQADAHRGGRASFY